jgi:hypothetical protein
MIKLFLINLNILLKLIIKLLLTNLNILLKLNHYDKTIIAKFKYFIKTNYFN